MTTQYNMFIYMYNHHKNKHIINILLYIILNSYMNQFQSISLAVII